MQFVVRLIRKSKFEGVSLCTFWASNVGRIGPDPAEFRMFPGSPVITGEGMQFESHLGHVFSPFRGLRAADCVQISFMGPYGAHSCWRPLRSSGSFS